MRFFSKITCWRPATLLKLNSLPFTSYCSLKFSNSYFQESLSITVVNKSEPLFLRTPDKGCFCCYFQVLVNNFRATYLALDIKHFHVFVLLRSHFPIRNVISFIPHFRKILFIIASYIFNKNNTQ